MVVAMAGFGLNDALMKLTAGQVTLAQAIFVRGLLATALIAVLAWRLGALKRNAIARRDRRRVAWRVVGEAGAAVCFLTALFNMPIANAMAILQAIPLALTLAAALWLHEPVGWRRLSAVAIGFLGVLVIIRPGFAGFTVYSLWALAAVGFLVLRDLATRTISPDTSSAAVTLVTSAIITAGGGVVALAGPWQPMSPGLLGTLAAAAVFLFLGYLFAVMTMRVGEVAVVSPFRYTILLWAILAGVVLFDEWPDGWTLAGSAVVVGTGLYTFYRERRIARRSAPSQPRDH